MRFSYQEKEMGKGKEGELVLEMATNKRIVTQSVRQPAKWVSTSGRNERSISHLRYCKGGE